MVSASTSSFARRQLAHFEDCASAIDQLFQQSLREQGVSAFDEFLLFAQRFKSLSVYNAMLVRIQRPGASAVGSQRDWARIGRQVLPGAVPIVVLQGFGPVRFLFEISDTDGKPVTGEQANHLFAWGPIKPDQLAGCIAMAEHHRVEVVNTRHMGALLAGHAVATGRSKIAVRPGLPGDGPWYRVTLNAHLDLPSCFATLAHELSHVYCGHLGPDCRGSWPDRRSLHPAVMELEAEAAAWLACVRCDVETRSVHYLAGLIHQAPIDQVSVFNIFQAANRIEARSPPKKPREPAGPADA